LTSRKRRFRSTKTIPPYSSGLLITQEQKENTKNLPGRKRNVEQGKNPVRTTNEGRKNTHDRGHVLFGTGQTDSEGGPGRHLEPTALLSPEEDRTHPLGRKGNFSKVTKGSRKMVLGRSKQPDEQRPIRKEKTIKPTGLLKQLRRKKRLQLVKVREATLQ